MPKHFVVAPGQEFVYPADRESLNIVTFNGGFSKLSPEDRKRVRLKTVREGEDCSDMPESSLAIFLARGQVLEVAPAEKPSPVAKVEPTFEETKDE